MSRKLNSVLLIDDDEPTNIFTSIVLEETGCANHIQVAQSGQEALNYLSDCMQNNKMHFPPDLIFLDINMPAMDGWEFLDEYKKLVNSSDSKVIVVMLTTSLNPDDKIKAEARPEITRFENKPLTEEKIDKILKEYFSEQLAEMRG